MGLSRCTCIWRSHVLTPNSWHHECTYLVGKFRLDSSFRSDITWWVNFLQTFNGTRMFLDNLPTVDVATDTCPISAWRYFRGDWFYRNFSLDSPEWDTLHINHKETLAIVLAATWWGRLWSNQRVVINSDNQAAVHIINKGTTSNPLVMQALRALFWLSAVNNFHITAVYLEGANNHSPTLSRTFMNPKPYLAFTRFSAPNFLQSSPILSRWQHTCLFTDFTSSLADPRDPTLASQLNHEIQEYHSQLFAESTKATYKTHRNTYLRFCRYMGYTPVPIHPTHLQHAAFLARSLKLASISSYLSIIGILHKEFGLPNPLSDNWPLKWLLTGIRRATGTPPNQKLPVTPVILIRLHSTLNFTKSLDSSF